MISTQRQFGARAFLNVFSRIERADLDRFCLVKGAWQNCKAEKEALEALEDEGKTFNTMRRIDKERVLKTLDAKQEEALPFLETLFEIGTEKRALAKKLRSTFWRWQRLTAQEKRAKRGISSLVPPKPQTAKKNEF